MAVIRDAEILQIKYQSTGELNVYLLDMHIYQG